MGADFYCFICGIPLHIPNYTLQDVKKLKTFIEKNKIKINYKKLSDEQNILEIIKDIIKKYNLSNVFIKSIELPKKIPKKYNWIGDILLIKKDKILRECSKDDFYLWYHEEFPYNYEKNNKRLLPIEQRISFACHNSCYKLMNKNGYNLSFDLLFKKIKDPTYPFSPKIYKIAELFQFQWFDWISCLLFYPYLLENPLYNTQNQKRILSLKLPFKKQPVIKKSNNKFRKAPSEKAGNFKVGYKKIGNDGNMWIIKTNKNKIKRWHKI